MAEYIKREAIGKAYMDLCLAKSKLAKSRKGATFFQSDLLPETEPTTKELFRLVMAMPAADVAEVVRCRECAHYKICDEWESGNRMLCEIHHHSYLDHDGDNHFCSWGQRKIETILPKSDAKDESLEANHD